MTLTDEQLAELVSRSSNGEGVRSVLASFGCDDGETLVWLRDNHHQALKAAKAAFAADPVKVEARKAAYVAELEAKEIALAAEKVAEVVGPL